MPRQKTPKPRRRSVRPRLPAGQAREQILDVAAQRLRDVGPDGLRLQDIAREVGVSHPAILHHFGSRHELVRAVVDRSLGQLEQQVIDELANAADRREVDAMGLFATIRSLMEGRGNARLIAWLVLAGYESPAQASKLGEIARVVHALRQMHFAARGDEPPAYEDTLFVVLLAGVAMFGDALCGATLRDSAGLGGDPDASRRFHAWMARLLVDHLNHPNRAGTSR